jgi:hypothetical protein
MESPSISDQITLADERIASLELEIARLQTRVTDMKKSRNSLTPFCRLPSEILGRIFLHTQVPTRPNQNQAIQHESLYDFGYNPAWEKAMSTCSHIYSICSTTPELWAYIHLSWSKSKIERYVSRLKDVNLTFLWGGRVDEDKRDATNDLDVGLASACFRQASAAKLKILYHVRHEIERIINVINQSAPRLLSLHLDLDNNDVEHLGLHLLSQYPSLTELSFAHLGLRRSINAPLPLLSRLHINTLLIDYHLHPLLDTIKQTPNLTELVLEYIWSRNEQEHRDVAPRDGLNLVHLCKLELSGSYNAVHTLFMALSPRMPVLQNMQIHPLCPDADHITRRMSSDIFRKTMKIWSSISSRPLPPARMTWSLYRNVFSFLDICTAVNIFPALGLHTLFCDEEESRYNLYGLKFDRIEVEGVEFGQISVPWTTLLNQSSTQFAPRLKQLTFRECNHGVPGLKGWIRQKKLEGCMIEKVSFIHCRPCLANEEPITMGDFEKLKKSGLVRQVEWVN